VVLSAERPRVRVPGVHLELHHGVAEELVGWPREDGAGEDPQGSLDSVGVSPRSWSHLGGSDRAVSCPRSRAAPEAAASPLRDDSRPAPLDGYCDHTVAPVATRGPASHGAGDREVDLLVAAVAAALDAPQREDRKNCELLSSQCILFAFVMTSIFSEFFFSG
jgi:hypothetical protein